MGNAQRRVASLRLCVMADLLTPEEVREFRFDLSPPAEYGMVGRLCRDYLTLWDRNEELEAAVQRHIDIGEYRD